jgi:nicotinamide mononucleotide adenylyltransferase
MVNTHYFVPMRVQPAHKGHLGVLEALVGSENTVTIGIGSANKMDNKNPYTAKEREMILTYDLEKKGYMDKVTIVHVPDFKTDEEWITYLHENNAVKKTTTIVSGNEWVKQIFPNNQVFDAFATIKNPVNINATKLREMMRQGDETWMEYATDGTKQYFEAFGGASRL